MIQEKGRKILSIGNSFSADAQRYLHGVSHACGVELDCVNLMIGGCSLKRHYDNIETDAKAYGYHKNGNESGPRVSIREVLEEGGWDTVTLQQVSQESPCFETYMPYLSALAELVRRYAPRAQLLIHETWAYESGSERLCRELRYETDADMLRDIIAAYRKAADAISADGIIPSGEMMKQLLDSGIKRVHRDTYHAAFGVGRYALACLWARMLCGVTVTGNGFSSLDEPVTQEERRIIERVCDGFQPINMLQKG